MGQPGRSQRICSGLLFPHNQLVAGEAWSCPHLGRECSILCLPTAHSFALEKARPSQEVFYRVTLSLAMVKAVPSQAICRCACCFPLSMESLGWLIQAQAFILSMLSLPTKDFSSCDIGDTMSCPIGVSCVPREQGPASLTASVTPGSKRTVLGPSSYSDGDHSSFSFSWVH